MTDKISFNNGDFKLSEDLKVELIDPVITHNPSAGSNIIDLALYNEEVLFSSLDEEDKRMTLLACGDNQETKQELLLEGAKVPKSLIFYLKGISNAI